MSKQQRMNKAIRRWNANLDAYRERFNKALDRIEKKQKSDMHMQHDWINDFLKLPRKPALIHNGRKP